MDPPNPAWSAPSGSRTWEVVPMSSHGSALRIPSRSRTEDNPPSSPAPLAISCLCDQLDACNLAPKSVYGATIMYVLVHLSCFLLSKIRYYHFCNILLIGFQRLFTNVEKSDVFQIYTPRSVNHICRSQGCNENSHAFTTITRTFNDRR